MQPHRYISCNMQPDFALLIIIALLSTFLLTGCGGGGGGGGGDSASSAVSNPVPSAERAGLAGLENAPRINLVMTTGFDVNVDLSEVGFAITDQTFVRVYRCDEDGSEHLVAVRRLEEGMTTARIRVILPSGLFGNCLRAEIYGPHTIGHGVPVPTAVG